MTGRKNPEALRDSEIDRASGGYTLGPRELIVSSYQTSGSGAGNPVPARGGNSVAMETIEPAVEKIERG